MAAIAATAMTSSEGAEQRGPPKAAMRFGVAPRKTMANTPSAMPTMANRRWGLALWAIVPWVKLNAQPTAAPATAMQDGERREVGDERRRKEGEQADREAGDGGDARIDAIESRRRNRLLTTAPTRNSVARPPACARSNRYCAISAPTHTGRATRSTMPAQWAIISAMRPGQLSVLAAHGCPPLESNRRRQRHQGFRA